MNHAALYDARPWQAHYANGTLANLAAPSANSLAEMVRNAANQFGLKSAFSLCLPDGTRASLNFGQVDQLSDHFAQYLRGVLKLNQGDRVAVQMPNCLAYPIVSFGILKAGCVLVNVNPLYTPSEMHHQLNDSQAKVLVSIDVFGDKINDGLHDTPVQKIILAKLSDFFDLKDRIKLGLYLKITGKIPKIKRDTESLTHALRAGKLSDFLLSNIKINLNDTALLQYTGGTTGRSKGAEITHGNFVWNIDQANNNINGFEVAELHNVMTVLPMYHAFAMAICFIGFRSGMHNILIPNPRPLDNLKKAFTLYDIHMLPGVNTLFSALLDTPWFVNNLPKNLSIAMSGGTALKHAVSERWQEVVGHPIYEGYGLTEASPGVSSNPVGNQTKHNSIGIPFANTDVRIVDDQGAALPLGQAGEIIVKGPQVMRGYWHKPEETANVIRDGWLYTGDIGYMDEEGYFFIVDRKKDMVLVSGFNVYPNEIEDVLAKHPAIADAGVVGVPDPKTGETPAAFVVARSHDLTPEEVRAYCRAHLTAYKMPKYIWLVEELPKTPVGKVLRKDLRDMALARVPKTALS